MRKTYILGLAVIIILAVGGGAYYFGNQNSSDSQASTDKASQQSTDKTDKKPTDTGEAIALDEIKKHDNKDDCWLAIEDNVYDPTTYISQHPGGKEILKGCGTDATKIFNDRPTGAGPHSSFARDTLTDYRIGTLAK